MIYYTTEIDTISLMITTGNDTHVQHLILQDIIQFLRDAFNAYIDSVEYYAGFDRRIEHKIYCNNRTVLSFSTGFTHGEYFIKIKFAGLKTYDHIVDNTSTNYLFAIMAYLNGKLINWKLSALDLAIDVSHVAFNQLLAICTQHTSGTRYHDLDEVQRYDNETTYIEKFESTEASERATKRAYFYNKTIKELVKHDFNIGFPLHRFEVKLQSDYFNKYGLDISTIEQTLNMYHFMYFDFVDDKNAVIQRYSDYSKVRKREIERMGLENHRLHFDMEYIYHFINILTHITLDDLKYDGLLHL